MDQTNQYALVLGFLQAMTGSPISHFTQNGIGPKIREALHRNRIESEEIIIEGVVKISVRNHWVVVYRYGKANLQQVNNYWEKVAETYHVVRISSGTRLAPETLAVINV